MSTDLESAIQAKGLKAPRIPSSHIDALMARVVIKTAVVEGTTTTVSHAFLDGRFQLASGTSACVSPENFDAEIGRNMAEQQAKEAARNKLWELEGYRLFARINEMPLVYA